MPHTPSRFKLSLHIHREPSHRAMILLPWRGKLGLFTSGFLCVTLENVD